MSRIDPREEALFGEALERSGSSRVAFLDEECGDDADLRRRVQELLSLHDTRDGLLDRSSTALVSREAEVGIGECVGPYRLVEEIGVGGMGVVYRAEQIEPVHREVALKLIKPGMDTRSVIARFEGERQALALLDHPAITRVLDAGATDTGRPYFVMELCRGRTITHYAEQRQLDLRHRLELFVQVCDAIEHAHQKGILHRDLKPSNLLVSEVDGGAAPKIIDFGIAKALTQPLTGESSVTYHGQILGTPEYMSPEQCENGLDVDTRTDVYSLGVILYELTTGVTPLGDLGAQLEDIRAAIRTTEPTFASARLRRRLDSAETDLDPSQRATLEKCQRELRGEVDWIVARALAKDRSDRYQSAADLGRDLRRYLAGDPVEAAAPSLRYRLRKTYQRHRVAVLTSGTIALTIVCCAVLSAALALRLQDSLVLVGRERDRAREAENQLALLERDQRNRAAVYRAMARFAEESLAGYLEEVSSSLGGLSFPASPDASDRHPLDAVLRDLEGNGNGRSALVSKVTAIVGNHGGTVLNGVPEITSELQVSFEGFDFESELDPESFLSRVPGEVIRYVLEEQRRAFGEDDPLVAETLLRWTELRMDAGAKLEAQKSLSEARQVLERAHVSAPDALAEELAELGGRLEALEGRLESLPSDPLSDLDVILDALEGDDEPNRLRRGSQ